MSQLNVDTIGSQTGSTISIASGHSLQNADGSAIGGGKILQVVSTASDVAASNSGTSYTQVLGTTITPSATTSKVLVLVSAHFSMSTDTYGGATLLRDGTEIHKSTATTGGGNANQYSVPINNRSGDAGWEARTISINHLDSPSTTSAITYHLGFRKDYGSQLMFNRPYYTNNAAYHWNVVSELVLIEVGE